jgi:hypothetical protein
MHPVQTSHSVFMIPFSNVLVSTPLFSKWSLLCRLYDQNVLCISAVLAICTFHLNFIYMLTLIKLDLVKSANT